MIAVAINRWISYPLIGIGVAIIAFGVYIGLFAWANDGFMAGIGVFVTSAAFGGVLIVTAFAFRFAAAAHARSAPRRWWIQLLPVVVAYVAFGVAASLTSYLDRLV